MRRTRTIGAVLVVLSLATMAGVALGTPGSGVTAVVVAAGTIANPIGIPQAPGEATWITETTFAPGGTTGWHSHPGKTLVVVASGTLTLYRARGDDCRVREFTAGEGFIERPTSVHVGVNEGDEPVVLGVTYFRIRANDVLRIDKPDPGVCVS
ncbi:MAG: cupin domain-containing protein [Actinomycetota bacterium]|nr:cupin domain-containing protein [Actinomycetota bacterium]